MFFGFYGPIMSFSYAITNFFANVQEKIVVYYYFLRTSFLHSSRKKPAETIELNLFALEVPALRRYHSPFRQKP